MICNRFFLFYILNLVYTCCRSQNKDVVLNQLLPLQVTTPHFGDLYLMQDKLEELQKKFVQQTKRFLHPFLRQSPQQNKVMIQLFYECLCPDCRAFDNQQFLPTVKKLSKRLDVHLYPYGNARTIIHKDGRIEVVCQHGPDECYGNMLHACAIDVIGNITQAVEFNSCMMNTDQQGKGSDNQAADKCGRLLNIDSEPIKLCASSPRGIMLLKYYGDESIKVGFKFVPYILINGKEYNGDNFFQDVCNIFDNPPPECNELNFD